MNGEQKPVVKKASVEAKWICWMALDGKCESSVEVEPGLSRQVIQRPALSTSESKLDLQVAS